MVEKVKHILTNVYYTSAEPSNSRASADSAMLPEMLAGNNNPNELSPKEAAIKSNGYKATPNENIFCDGSQYYKWDDKKGKFIHLKDTVNVLPSGYTIDKKGNCYDTLGKVIIKVKDGKLQAEGHHGWSDSSDLVQKKLADAYGYQKVERLNAFLGDVYYDKKTKEFKQYNNKNQTFDNMQMTDYTINPKGELISKTKNGDYIKYFDPYGEQRGKHTGSTEEEFNASKGGYRKYDKYNNVYTKTDKSGTNTYVYNPETKTFDKFSDEIYRQKMLETKADGKIDDFWQGDYIGDCWLLTVAKSAQNEYLPENVKKNLSKALESCISVNENGDVVIKLKGHKLPGGKCLEYKFTNSEINEAIKSGKYSVGDKDPVAIEMAVSNYSKQALESRYFEFRHADGFDETYLEAGHVYDTIRLLTGTQATTIGKDGEIYVYAYSTRPSAKKEKTQPLDENAIKQYMENNAVFAAYKTDNRNGHVVSLAKIDDEFVWYYDSNIDSSNPDKSAQLSKMKKSEFFGKLINITYTDFSEPIKDTKEQLNIRSKKFGIRFIFQS